MLGSKNYFFYKDYYVLLKSRVELRQTLSYFGIKDLTIWLKAFDYFVTNPHKYDGATIVKDLATIQGLDACAMVHDYRYLNIQKWWSINGLKSKLKADFEYGKNMELTGKGSITAYTRTALLWISTPFYYLIFKL
jgi:hypothetical protein